MAEIQIKKLTISDKEELKKVNSLIFSVNYNDDFYTGLFANKNTYAFFLIEKSIIGTFSCTVESRSAYILTFGILPKFRRQGKGKKCLEILETTFKLGLSCNYFSLHSHTSNLIAEHFYLSNGYKILSIIPEYYDDMVPTSAYHMGKHI